MHAATFNHHCHYPITFFQTLKSFYLPIPARAGTPLSTPHSIKSTNSLSLPHRNHRCTASQKHTQRYISSLKKPHARIRPLINTHTGGNVRARIDKLFFQAQTHPRFFVARKCPGTRSLASNNRRDANARRERLCVCKGTRGLFEFRERVHVYTHKVRVYIV